jgi:hypothetical protein
MQPPGFDSVGSSRRSSPRYVTSLPTFAQKAVSGGMGPLLHRRRKARHGNAGRADEEGPDATSD